MEIKGIKYVSPCLDNSGYGKAARGNIMALHELGIPLVVKPVSFESIRPDLGEEGRVIDSLIRNSINYNIVLTHTTPEFWEQNKEEGKAFVGYTIWETSKLHPRWPIYINNTADACLVGCEWNVQVFKDSGVTVPVFNVPHCVSLDTFKKANKMSIQGLNDSTFAFYSVLQFTERKCPTELIKAYWRAFPNGEDVALVLKTYRSDYSEPEKDAIRTTVKRLKKVSPSLKYPPIFLLLDMLSEEDMNALHLRGDCFVSLDRGEGFGLGAFQAGASGKPIIVTGFGGALEYAKPEHSYLVDYVETPVYGMPWCMSLNSLVKTSEGYIRAKHLVEGDTVINKNLQHKKINKVEFRPLTEKEEVYSMKCFSCLEEMELTGDHKLFVIENEVPVKKPVSKINVGDYLYVPKPALSNFTPKCLDEITSLDSEKIRKLFYVMGLYLAEGHIDKGNYYVSFSFNINEKETIAKKCKEIMNEIFASDINHIYERSLEDRNGYEINFFGSKIVNFFMSNFGTGSHKKFITDEIKYNELNFELLKGYWDGDGHIRKEGYKNKRTGKKRVSPECLVETASLDLVMDIRDVLLSLGIVPSLRKSKRSDGRITYVISVSDKIFDNIFGIKASRINNRFKIELPTGVGFGVLITKKELLENYDNLICSISVDKDKDEIDGTGGSYILNGIASSNSPWYLLEQDWAHPSATHGAKLMKHVFENQAEAKKKGAMLQKYIEKNFSRRVIGQKIVDAIRSI